jgi:hypothetical protein
MSQAPQPGATDDEADCWRDAPRLRREHPGWIAPCPDQQAVVILPMAHRLTSRNHAARRSEAEHYWSSQGRASVSAQDGCRNAASAAGLFSMRQS